MLISHDSRTRCCAVLGLLFAAPTAQADDMDILIKAGELASVIASEEFCSLTYDQAAIQAWVADNVPAEDMNFANQLNVGIMGAEFRQKDMTRSAKTAHCAAIEQTAKYYKFTQD